MLAGRIQMRPGLRMSIAQEQQALGLGRLACESASQCVADVQADLARPESGRVMQGCAELVASSCAPFGRVQLVTGTPVPAGLRVEVQGRAVDVASGTATVFVEPGNVAVRATVDGREAFAQGLEVRRGLTANVSLEMTTRTPVEAPVAQSGSGLCTTCPVPMGGSATCVGGVCGQSCPSGTALCGSACERLTTMANCGACGRVCNSGQTCSGGACLSPREVGTGSCPEGMAYIPAGSFLMGDADTASDGAQPPHMVTLSAYCMDLTEVTVAAYRGCTSCTAPTAGTTGNYGNWGGTGRDNHPVNLVDWNQARAYCQWRGGDLPTEAQWEYAARGSDVANHIYPWGNEAAVLQLCWNRFLSPGSTCSVQSYPSGNSPFGLSDMAGNVWEWTRDFYASYTSAAAIDPTGPTSGASRVFRGGSWYYTSASPVRAAYRSGYTPVVRDDRVGFRCARGAT